MTQEPATQQPAQVELRVPAERAYVAVLRTLTAGLAARCDLTLDQIEDLRIAVDEACALLLPHAPEAAVLTARFTVEANRLGFVASLPAPPDAQPDRSGFTWTVLSALAEDLHVTSADGTLSIGLTKQREASPQ